MAGKTGKRTERKECNKWSSDALGLARSADPNELVGSSDIFKVLHSTEKESRQGKGILPLLVY